MTTDPLAERAAAHLQHLCVRIPTRVVGSQGNRDATAYCADVCRAAGWTVETPTFDCTHWTESGAELRAGAASFEVLVSPYSLPVQVSAPLAMISTAAELEGADLVGKVVLLRGDIAREQLAPKNFPWWNPEEHQRIIAALERAAPLAIVAATERNPETAGAVYPFALIEDGDFDIPTAHMTAEEVLKLAVYAGRTVDLELRASRAQAVGCNVEATRARGPHVPRVVVTAHIDAKQNTPGAVDNGGGTVVLLLLAELLADQAETPLELVVFNGEDYYAASGEKLFVDQNGDLTGIDLNINIDGAGFIRGQTHFSFYNCDDSVAAQARRAFESHGLVEGPQWVQGDHSIFAMAGRPAIAITTEFFEEICATITHTPKDTVEMVDPNRLAQVARAIAAFAGQLRGR